MQTYWPWSKQLAMALYTVPKSASRMRWCTLKLNPMGYEHELLTVLSMVFLFRSGTYVPTTHFLQPYILTLRQAPGEGHDDLQGDTHPRPKPRTICSNL